MVDFATRKILNIGLDPAHNFNVAIHIISVSHRIYLYYHDFIGERADKEQTVSVHRRYGDIGWCVSVGSRSVLKIESIVHDGGHVILDRAGLVPFRHL